MKRRNVLRELINEDRPSIGIHLICGWPGIVEVIGHTRAFDYVEFVSETGPYDLHDLDNFGRAVDLFDHMSSMIKIDQEPKTYLATRAIGAGFQNLLFADIRTVEDAREAVAAARPEISGRPGHAGAVSRRDTGYGFGSTATEQIEAMQEGVVALMIEKESAVNDLEGILSVEGVDMVQFGSRDYAMSIGVTGQWDHPRVREAQQYVMEMALKKGVAPRIELGDSRGAEPYIEMGIKHFCIGWDLSIIGQWCMEHGSVLAKKLGR
jgi:2-keto-3-deoxy-L-rhamnonate aldolase RhmA